MKWICGGLTFVNIATICGLFLGIVRPGIDGYVAFLAFVVGMAAAIFAYLRTLDYAANTNTSTRDPATKLSQRQQGRQSAGTHPEPQPVLKKYSNAWTWVLAVFFTLFAVRSFCWLLYIDGEELRIQSPNNLGDLALHITHINYFANGIPLWPANPIYVFSDHLRYPAGIDLFNALLSCLHVDLITGLVWTGLLASASTFYALYRWGRSFAVAGFLFNGGMAGFQFLHSWKFLDYQGERNVAWKSIPLSMFVTQRGLLYAIPAGLILLWHWREKYFRETAPSGPATMLEENAGWQNVIRRGTPPLPFWVELSLYASMPLFHFHTFLALTIVLICFFFLGSPATRGYVFVLLICAFIPATFFTWLITDHFQAKSVLEWHPGWVQGWSSGDEDFKMPFFRFWLFNFGILVPLLLTLIGFTGWRLIQSDTNQKFKLTAVIALGVIVLCVFRIWSAGFGRRPLILLLFGLALMAWAISRLGRSGSDRNSALSEELVFLAAAGAVFVLTFFIKFAPWGWDNLKIMIWAYLLVLPILWKDLISEWDLSIRVAVCFALFASGFVSLFGGLAARGFSFIDRAEMDGVGVGVRSLPIEARFAAFPTYNHPLLLQGRKVALGYPGHLWTQGFDDYGKANDLLSNLMQGGQNWEQIARDLKVRYIFWGREEKTNYGASTRPWEKTVPVATSGTWGTIYDLEAARQTSR
jgi:hypothetical protein